MGSKGKGQSVCPECGYRFRGQGFDGIDAHWRAKHEYIMPYEEAWPLIESGAYKKIDLTVKPCPELSLEVLQEGRFGCAAAVKCPLPKKPSFELLEAARRNVLEYLDRYSHEAPDTNLKDEQIVKILRSGFDKLCEITIMQMHHNPFI